MTYPKTVTAKRATALLLALLMLFSIVPFSGFMIDEAHAAAGDTPEEAIPLSFVSDQQRVVEGRVWVDNIGSVIVKDVADVAKGGVPLIIQWIDTDGSMSPFYTTTTNPDGQFRVLIPSFKDSWGATHTFTAKTTQKLKVSVQEKWLADNGYSVVMDKLHGNFGSSADAMDAGWLYDQTPGGAGQRVNGYFIVLQTTNRDDMHLPEESWEFQETPASVVDIAGANSVRGRVYWDWEYTAYINSYPEKNSKDPAAVGILVKLTIADSNGNKVKTYTTRTNADGEFLIEMGSGIPNYNPQIDLRNSFVSIEAPEHASVWSLYGDRGYMNPGLLGRGSTGHADGTTNYLRNARFALVPKDHTFEVLKYDTTSNFASPGETVQTLSTGLAPDSGIYRIEWKNMDTGAVVTEHKNLVPGADGTLSGYGMIVPDDLTKTTIFQATLYSPDNRPLGVEAFAVAITSANTPIGAEGVEYTGEVLSPALPGHTYTYAVDPATPLPKGLLFNETTGKITGTPEADTAGAYAVNFIVNGKGPDADSVAYKMNITKNILIFNGDANKPAMEEKDTAKDVNIDFDAVELPAGYTLTRTVEGLPNAVAFTNKDLENLAGAPEVDVDTETTIHKVDITYTVTYPDPKDPTKTITETVTQKDKDFVVLEKLTIAGTLPDGRVGVEYPATTPTVVGGEGPYTYMATGLPDGLAIDPNTGEITGVPTAKGDYPVVITVTDAHGYTATLSQTVKVTDPENEKYEPTGQDITVDLNGTPNAADGIANKGDLPGDAIYSFKETPITTTAGTFPATVVVTYGDGTTDEVLINIIVQDDAAKNDPLGKDIDAKVGDELGDAEAASAITNKDDLPAGTTYSFKDPVDTATEGEKDAIVVVTYPDGSKDDVPIKVNVTKTDAQTYDPTGQDITVDLNGTPVADNGIANAADMPAGTTYAFKEAPVTTTAGTFPATVVVTYPDKTSEEVNINIIVQDDAAKNDPTGQDIDAKVGDKLSDAEAASAITNKDDLPIGTTYSFKDPVDTTTEGIKDAIVVVAYPDGSQDEVPIKVNVAALEPSAAPTNLSQDKQTVVGEIKDFAPGTDTTDWEVVLTDMDGKVLTYTDPDTNEVKPIVGTVDPAGTFTIPIDYPELKHDQEVKAQLTEPGKTPTISVPTNESVKLDKQGPDIVNSITTPDAGLLLITGKTNEPAENLADTTFTVTVGDVTYPATVDDAGNITANIPANIPGDIKIVGVDKFGNESTVSPTAATAPETFNIRLTTVQSRATRLLVASDRGTATISVKVYRDGKLLVDKTETADTGGQAPIGLGTRLAVGDKITINATFGALNSNEINMIVQK